MLLCEHNEEGSFGFVLNKASAVTLDEIVEGFEHYKQKAFIGGPVQQDTLHFIHRADYLEGGSEITDGLYWGGNFEQLLALMNTRQVQEEDFRFFVGYSGWGAGQLEDEIKADSWIVANYATPELVFDEKPSNLWRIVLKYLGGRFDMYSNYPIDPRLN